MSKETMMASDCACGQRIQFMEQHVEHCASAKQAIKSGQMKLTEKETNTQARGGK